MVLVLFGSEPITRESASLATMRSGVRPRGRSGSNPARREDYNVLIGETQKLFSKSEIRIIPSHLRVKA